MSRKQGGTIAILTESYWSIFQSTFIFVSLLSTVIFVSVVCAIKGKKNLMFLAFNWVINLLNLVVLVCLTYFYIFLKEKFNVLWDIFVIGFICYCVALFLVVTFLFIKTISKENSIMKEYRAPVILLAFSITLQFISLIGTNDIEKLNFLIDPYLWSWLISIFLGFIAVLALIFLFSVDIFKFYSEKKKRLK